MEAPLESVLLREKGRPWAVQSPISLLWGPEQSDGTGSRWGTMGNSGALQIKWPPVAFGASGTALFIPAPTWIILARQLDRT